LLVIGFLCCASVLGVFIYLTVRAELKNQGSARSAFQKILVNFFAMVSLAGSLPLDWPETLENMFAWSDVVSSAGSNLLIPDCELSALKTADVHYLKQIFYTCIPPLISLVCLVSWLCIWRCCSRSKLKCASKSAVLSGMSWTRMKDVTILSIVLVLFLCYPLLAKLALSSLKCTTVANRSYLLADLQEPCFEGRHMSYLLALTFPQILVYVIAMPLSATYLIVRSGSRRLHTSNRLHMRYSLLFVGYVEGREWWEACIVVRKVSMVLLSTFGSMAQSVEKNACISLIIIFLSIIAHLLGKPFGTRSGKAWRLHILELMALFVVWFISWCGLMLYLSGRHNGGAERQGSELESTFLTVLVVLSIACYLSGALYTYLYGAHGKLVVKLRASILRKMQSPQSGSGGGDHTIAAGAGAGVAAGAGAAVSGHSLVHVAPSLAPPASDQHQPTQDMYSGTLEHVVSAIHQEHDMHEKALAMRNEKQKRASLARTKSRLSQRAYLKKSKKLHAVPCFASLSEVAIGAMIDTMDYETHSQGDVLCAQGEEAGAFYVVCEGRCVVSISTSSDPAPEKTTERLKVGVIESGSHFGHQAFETDPESGGPTLRKATVTVESESCKILVLSRDKFFKLRGQGNVLDEDVMKMLEEVERARERQNEVALGASQMGEEGESTGRVGIDKKATEPITQEAKLEGVFRSFDRNGNGRLNVAEFSKMMSKLGQAMDANTARELILRDTELEISFEGFCNIVRAAGTRSNNWDSLAASPSPPPPPQPKAGRAGLNAIVLEKYKNNHSSSGT
jgi:CRP-like cAMP-binding protein